jgi:RNA polymerase sigma-70 factor (ECF subfamily)
VPGEIMDIALMADKLGLDVKASGNVNSNARLIARAQAGDATAFDQIIVGHQHRVIALAWRLLGNPDDARDAAQESFLRVYQHLQKIDLTQDFSGWLYRIVVNVCRDMERKRRRGKQTSLEAEVASGSLREPASAHNTEAAAIFSQEQALIARALTTLTAKERAAIVLRDLEGFSTDEVARILGSRPTTVRSQISSGRAKMKLFRDRWLKGKGTLSRRRGPA